MLTREEVALAFRLILGREPESEQTFQYHQRYSHISELRRVLISSEEFQTMLSVQRATADGIRHWVRTEIPHGLSLWVDLNDDGVSAGCLRGNWEPTETNFIFSILKPGDVFVDIGANLGWYTVKAAQAVGQDGHVYAFEPRSDIFEKLKRSVAENALTDICTLQKIALGSVETVAELAWSVAERNQGHSFIVEHGASASVSATDRETIRITTLDSIQIDQPVRLIKIDVEGFEPKVLQGGRGLIERDQPIIVAELFPKWLRLSGGIEPLDFVHMLDGLGYETYYLTDQGIGRRIGILPSDLNSDYIYYPVVFLPPHARASLLDGRQDARVQDLEKQIALLSSGVPSSDNPRNVVPQEESQIAAATSLPRPQHKTSDLEARARRAELQVAELSGRLLQIRTEAQRLTAVESERARLLDELKHVQAENELLQAKIHAIHGSSSWRATAPLRWAKLRAHSWRQGQ